MYYICLLLKLHCLFRPDWQELHGFSDFIRIDYDEVRHCVKRVEKVGPSKILLGSKPTKQRKLFNLNNFLGTRHSG